MKQTYKVVWWLAPSGVVGEYDTLNSALSINLRNHRGEIVSVAKTWRGKQTETLYKRTHRNIPPEDMTPEQKESGILAAREYGWYEVSTDTHMQPDYREELVPNSFSGYLTRFRVADGVWIPDDGDPLF